MTNNKDKMKSLGKNLNWIPWYWWILYGIFIIILSESFEWIDDYILTSNTYDLSMQFIIKLLLLIGIGVAAILFTVLWIKLVAKYVKIK